MFELFLRPHGPELQLQLLQGLHCHFLEGQDTSFPCHQCRKWSCHAKLRPNNQLGKVAEKAKELALAPDQLHAPLNPASRIGSKSEAAKEMCKEHLEALKLFCQGDQALICVVCDRCQKHRLHTVLPAEAVAEEYKVQLLRHLVMLKCKKDSQEIIAVNGGKRLEILVGRVEAERQQTDHTFQCLQKILRDRESHLLQALSK